MVTIKQAQDILDYTVNFIITFGYVGVSLIFLVIAYFIRNSYKIVATVCCTAGLALLLAYAGFDLLFRNFPEFILSRSNIMGVILNVKQNETVHVEVGNRLATRPYIRRDVDPQSALRSQYYFISFWQRNYACITIAIDIPEPEDKLSGVPARVVSRMFGVAVEENDRIAERQIVITVQHDSNGKMSGAVIRHHESSRPVDDAKILTFLPVSADGCEDVVPVESTNHVFHWIIPSARAEEIIKFFSQSKPNMKDPKVVAELLQSEDPFVRRHARDELAEIGVDAVPIIQDLLQKPDYRLKLGALVALGKLPAPVRANVPDVVWQLAENLRDYPDSTMQEAAQYALKK